MYEQVEKKKLKNSRTVVESTPQNSRYAAQRYNRAKWVSDVTSETKTLRHVTNASERQRATPDVMKDCLQCALSDQNENEVRLRTLIKKLTRLLADTDKVHDTEKYTELTHYITKVTQIMEQGSDDAKATLLEALSTSTHDDYEAPILKGTHNGTGTDGLGTVQRKKGILISLAVVSALGYGIYKLLNRSKKNKKKPHVTNNKDAHDKISQIYSEKNNVINGIKALNDGFQEKNAETSCYNTLLLLMNTFQDTTIPIHNIINKTQALKMEHGNIVKTIEEHLGKNKPLVITLNPNHYFILLPLPDDRVAVLQGWQGLYTLTDCLKSDKHTMQKAELIRNLKMIDKTETVSGAATKLFDMKGDMPEDKLNTVHLIEDVSSFTLKSLDMFEVPDKKLTLNT